MKPIATLNKSWRNGPSLVGYVEGHKLLEDGRTVITSRVQGVVEVDGEKLVETYNTLYRLPDRTPEEIEALAAP